MTSVSQNKKPRLPRLICAHCSRTIKDAEVEIVYRLQIMGQKKVMQDIVYCHGMQTPKELHAGSHHRNALNYVVVTCGELQQRKLRLSQHPGSVVETLDGGITECLEEVLRFYRDVELPRKVEQYVAKIRQQFMNSESATGARVEYGSNYNLFGVEEFKSSAELGLRGSYGVLMRNLVPSSLSWSRKDGQSTMAQQIDPYQAEESRLCSIAIVDSSTFDNRCHINNVPRRCCQYLRADNLVFFKILLSLIPNTKPDKWVYGDYDDKINAMTEFLISQLDLVEEPFAVMEQVFEALKLGVINEDASFELKTKKIAELIACVPVASAVRTLKLL